MYRTFGPCLVRPADHAIDLSVRVFDSRTTALLIIQPAEPKLFRLKFTQPGKIYHFYSTQQCMLHEIIPAKRSTQF